MPTASTNSTGSQPEFRIAVTGSMVNVRRSVPSLLKKKSGSPRQEHSGTTETISRLVSVTLPQSAGRGRGEAAGVGVGVVAQVPG